VSDVPEQILDRLEALLASMSGLTGCWRDRGDMESADLPAALLLDGGEELLMDVPPTKSVYMPPAIFALRPQIFIMMKERDDTSNLTLNGVSAPIGAEISFWRSAVLNAVVNDADLISILGGPRSAGQIVYQGFETDMQSGGLMIGRLQMKFEFRYLLTMPR
jgi:hypothetical protein